MKKSSIIVYSSIIIAVFALLFYMENPTSKPKSEVKTFLARYQGKKGFTILKVPDFLLGEIVNSDSLSLNKESFKSFRILMLHEKQSRDITCNVMENELLTFLDSLKFKSVLEKSHDDSMQIKVFNRKETENWTEDVTLFTSDSTLFLFNFISDIDDDQLIRFSDHLSKQDVL
jgi:hypothetical protein